MGRIPGDLTAPSLASQAETREGSAAGRGYPTGAEWVAGIADASMPPMSSMTAPSLSPISRSQRAAICGSWLAMMTVRYLWVQRAGAGLRSRV